MSFILKASSATCHGHDSSKLFQGLYDFKQSENTPGETPHRPLAHRNAEDKYLDQILSAVKSQIENYKEEFKDEALDKWGFILASTKGVIEDQIWTANSFENLSPYSPLLSSIEEIFPFPISKKVCVSNACTSSHGAIELAQRWLKRKWVDHVFIVGADLIGRFTINGFKSLRALSGSTNPKPFDVSRDGLKLGDAIASCVLSQKKKNSLLEIAPVKTICEGVSATRPDLSGKNLAQCFLDASAEKTPDLLIAHGTGTYYNDKTEAEAFALCFENKKPPRVTCSKWSLGHSLGASGLVDLNLAIECLERQSAPGIHTLKECDLKVSEYVLYENQEMKMDSILVSSLGFGGVCSAYQINKVES